MTKFYLPGAHIRYCMHPSKPDTALIQLQAPEIKLKRGANQTDLIFAIDNSGSMGELIGYKTKLNALKETLLDFFDKYSQINSEHILNITLMAFDSNTKILQTGDYEKIQRLPLNTDNVEKIKQALEDLQPMGGTDIVAAMEEMRNLLKEGIKSSLSKSNLPGNVCGVLLSDGGHNSGRIAKILTKPYPNKVMARQVKGEDLKNSFTAILKEYGLPSENTVHTLGYGMECNQETLESLSDQFIYVKPGDSAAFNLLINLVQGSCPLEIQAGSESIKTSELMGNREDFITPVYEIPLKEGEKLDLTLQLEGEVIWMDKPSFVPKTDPELLASFVYQHFIKSILPDITQQAKDLESKIDLFKRDFLPWLYLIEINETALIKNVRNFIHQNLEIVNFINSDNRGKEQYKEIEKMTKTACSHSGGSIGRTIDQSNSIKTQMGALSLQAEQKLKQDNPKGLDLNKNEITLEGKIYQFSSRLLDYVQCVKNKQGVFSYSPFSNREVIFSHEQDIEAFYPQLKKAVQGYKGKSNSLDDILKACIDCIQAYFNPVDVERAIAEVAQELLLNSNNKNIERIKYVHLSQLIEIKKGVCRHMAHALALTMACLVRDGLLPEGEVKTHRATGVEATEGLLPCHTYVTYFRKEPKNAFTLLDPTNLIPFYNYKGPSDKESFKEAAKYYTQRGLAGVLDACLHGFGLVDQILPIESSLIEDANKKRNQALANSHPDLFPPEYICPITKKIITHPVRIAGEKTLFDKKALEAWEDKRVHPITEEELDDEIKIEECPGRRQAIINALIDYCQLKPPVEEACETEKYCLPTSLSLFWPERRDVEEFVEFQDDLVKRAQVFDLNKP